MQGGPATTRRAGHRPVRTVAISSEASEVELVRAAKQTPAAFEPLYRIYADPVYRYCYRRLGTPEQAADATSQVFIKALTALQGCRDETFRSWLFSIAHNVLMDTFRQQRPDIALDEEIELVSKDASPEEIAIAADDRLLIVRLLALLTPDQRQVVELRLAGLNGNEIAAALGRSRASVDTAQSRAISRLRALLTGGEGDQDQREARDAFA